MNYSLGQSPGSMMKQILVFTFQAVLLAALSSCAPKPVARVYPVPKTDFGPIQKDPDLKIDKLHVLSVDSSKVSWKATVNSARVFRFAESMLQLAETKKSAPLLKLGQKVGNEFYSSRGTVTRTTFAKSLFITAAVGETKQSTMPLLLKNDAMLESQSKLIHDLLLKSAKGFKWPTAQTPPVDALASASQFARQFLATAEDGRLDPDVLQGISKAFETDFFPLIRGLAGEIDSVLMEKSSITMIDRLNALTKKYDFQLGPVATKELIEARGIFVAINAMESNQDALTVIVRLWKMTAQESRQKTFEPVSAELYDYLKDKDDGDLKCLTESDCLSPLIFVPKHVAILPAIEKYGVPKLKTDIGLAAHKALVKQISESVSTFVPTLPAMLDEKIADELEAIRKTIAGIKSNYSGFLQGLAREFEVENLGATKDQPARVPGLEANQVSIDLAPGSIAFTAVDPRASDLAAHVGHLKPKSSASSPEVLTTGSEVIGDSMAYSVALWQTVDPSTVGYQKSVIGQINKLFALGGFRTESQKIYPSLSISLDPAHPNDHFNARKDTGSPIPFAVPDSVGVTDDLLSTTASKNVGVRGQAELLRGLSEMVRYLRDWEKSGFDDSLGSVQVGKLIKTLPAGSVTSKLFPKDSFFALGIAESAGVLTNLTKALSPVFTIDITRKVVWASNRVDDSDQPATTAAIVDIVGGQRSTVVHVEDVARYLLAVADFLDASKGLENTKAAPLVTPDQNGKRPIDQLIEARTSMTMLIVGLANFISHEMQTKDGGIRATFHQDLVSVNSEEPRKSVDQALCILALVKAGEVLNKDIYIWPALDAYSYMNHALYDAKRGFYRVAEGPLQSSTDELAPDEIAMILLAGETLRSHMSDVSQRQWDMISLPWITALEGLN